MNAASDGPAVDDALIGALLDERYRVSALIGRGGVATVYRATDTALGREVAVKVFRGVEGLDDPARRASETALLASLAHPALVMLHDAVHDRVTGREFLVMELVEGPNLRERLDDTGPLAAGEAATMTVELAEALHVIHARGIVHRDVKPGNVLLAPSAVPTRAWRAKLADFGIARLVDDSRLTATGGLIGTPQYLAPEQVRGQGATSASDIYALGLLLLESRTGRPVFPGPALEAASARLTRDPELPGFLDTDWRELLAGMLARDPAGRPAALDVALAAAALGPDLEPDLERADTSAGGPAAAADAPERRLRATSASSAPAGVAQSVGTGAAVAGDLRVPAASGSDATEALDQQAFADGGTAQTMLLGDLAGSGTSHAPLRATSGGSTPAEVAQKRESGAAAAAATGPARTGDGATRAGAGATRAGDRDGGPRRAKWVIPVAIIVPLLIAAALSVPLLMSTVADGGAQPTPTPIPSVPGELGVHLEELQEAVTP